VSECDREASTMRKPRHTRGCRAIGKKRNVRNKHKDILGESLVDEEMSGARVKINRNAYCGSVKCISWFGVGCAGNDERSASRNTFGHVLVLFSKKSVFEII
jgi:hypothetical protein